MYYIFIDNTDRQSAQISQKQDGHNTYVIMKTMCPPGHHQNGLVTTQAFVDA